MLKYLLDTNIVIYVIKRRPLEVMGVFNENAGRMAISAITLSELYHGAEKSAKVPAWPELPRPQTIAKRGAKARIASAFVAMSTPTPTASNGAPR